MQFVPATGDKENKTPPALTSPTMTDEERRKKEDEDMQRAIELSLKEAVSTLVLSVHVTPQCEKKSH